MRQGNNRIAVGICGGIAAYKIPSLIRVLIKDGAEVKVILTDNGSMFVSVPTLSVITGYPVVTSLFPDNGSTSTAHISLAEWANVLVIAPATANIIGKCANGIADDFLSTLYLSTNKPVVFVPSMNTAMLNNAAVQKNIKTLIDRGHTVLETVDGELACGTSGKGRLPSENELFYYIKRELTRKKLLGRKILVTLGGTEEPIDSVRVITNRSSGKMGLALAVEAWLRGAEVTLICASVKVAIPPMLRVINAMSASAMHSAVKNEFDKCDALIMAAAVSDFTPSVPSNVKIKKGETVNPVIALSETADILKSLASIKGARKILGFALEDQDGIERARSKMCSKGCDAIVLNGPETLGSDYTNFSILVQSEGTQLKFDKVEKKEAAAIILDAFLQ